MIIPRGEVLPLRFAENAEQGVRQGLGYASPDDALWDSRGRTVRCTPRRRTVIGPVLSGQVLFRKYRLGGNGRREWLLLHRLAGLGFGVPEPVCFASSGSRSVVVTLRVPGRAMDVLLHEAVASSLAGDAIGYCIECVAPMVRRLHDHGLFHRDLYWNHLFADGWDPEFEPMVIDVERVFRPWLRRRRWCVKDLAALEASARGVGSRTDRLRFLIAYHGLLPSDWKRWVREVGAKADRIVRHRPKYG